MNNSTVNFTTPEASTNSTNQSIGLLDNLDICGYSITFLFGLPTNSYVIWLIITGKGSGVASEFFNLSLSVYVQMVDGLIERGITVNNTKRKNNDVVNSDKDEEIVNQASSGEKSNLTINEDDKRSEKEQTTNTEETNNSTTQSIGLMDSLEICVYSINLFFSLPANSYIIWLIIIGTLSVGVASEFFILNLCVCELGICLNGLVFRLSRWISSLEITDGFLMGFTFTGRPLFQCLICVERYLAVVHPVTFLKYKPLRYRVICCTAIWIIILGSCLVCMYNLASDKICAHVWFLTMQLTLVISIQLFCLVAVLRALKQSGPGERRRAREEENHMKRRAFHLILVTTVNMIILYFPLTITGISVILTADNSPTVWFTSLTCFILAGFVQPVIYLHRTESLPQSSGLTRSNYTAAGGVSPNKRVPACQDAEADHQSQPTRTFLPMGSTP
ncbi:lysophosphatidic acid receptor 5-like [Megalobrama amblycephala]|uniref:lysophosphatidic acid receptor 5-like n=1 Tax=Megalobrama amblycephala TaxID=75352 RepID=UPI00201445A3|nr:lysophosphatidic acid receptor 5-like [Megalobrama amblycephala]